MQKQFTVVRSFVRSHEYIQQTKSSLYKDRRWRRRRKATKAAAEDEENIMKKKNILKAGGGELHGRMGEESIAH